MLCYLRVSHLHMMCFDQISPHSLISNSFSFPPNFPCSSFRPTVSTLCCLYGHGCGTDYPLKLCRYHIHEENCLFLPLRHQLSIALQLGIQLHEPFFQPCMDLGWLALVPCLALNVEFCEAGTIIFLKLPGRKQRTRVCV